MANETVLFKRGDSATITSTPVTDGQILFDTSGNGKMYLDNGTDRLEMGGAITVDASLSKTSTNAIQNKAVTGNILNSLAEVSAATQQNTIAGALALKEVNSSLTVNDNQFYFDYKDGKYGFNTDPNRGADTFSPFSSIEKYTMSGNYSSGYIYPEITISDYDLISIESDEYETLYAGVTLSMVNKDVYNFFIRNNTTAVGSFDINRNNITNTLWINVSLTNAVITFYKFK